MRLRAKDRWKKRINYFHVYIFYLIIVLDVEIIFD